MNAYAQTIDRPSLERAVITVERVIPAKAAGKPAAIKDTQGLSFGIWPDKAMGVNPGETYEIEFDMNGAYRNIKTIRAAGRPGPAPSQFTGGQQQNGAHQPAPPPPAHQAQPQGRENGNGGGNYYRPTAPRDSERMFVCSTLNAFISTGRIDCHRDHLAASITELRAAYAVTFGREDHQ